MILPKITEAETEELLTRHTPDPEAEITQLRQDKAELLAALKMAYAGRGEEILAKMKAVIAKAGKGA